jgi:hypothetical protein
LQSPQSSKGKASINYVWTQLRRKLVFNILLVPNKKTGAQFERSACKIISLTIMSWYDI